MCCPDNAKFLSVKIYASVRKIMSVIREYKQSLKEIDLYHYISDLIDRHSNFDQWEFMWARDISFLPVLTAGPPFIHLFPCK